MKITKEDGKIYVHLFYSMYVSMDRVEISRKQAKKLKKQLKKALKPDFQPDWNNAPDWANWCACDEDGDVYYFKEEPIVTYESWASVPVISKAVIYIKNIGYQKNWKKMIWRRPE